MSRGYGKREGEVLQFDGHPPFFHVFFPRIIPITFFSFAAEPRTFYTPAAHLLGYAHRGITHTVVSHNLCRLSQYLASRLQTAFLAGQTEVHIYPEQDVFQVHFSAVEPFIRAMSLRPPSRVTAFPSHAHRILVLRRSGPALPTSSLVL